MAVSSLSYASGLITIWSLPKCQNPAPKGSWPRFCPTWPFQLFLCQRSNNHLEFAQMPKSSSKRLLATILPNMAVSSFSYVSGQITIWSLLRFQNPASKASWPGFGPKWPFPFFFLVRSLIARWSLPKCQNPALKRSRPGFGPKWPFPVFFVSSFIARWSLPKCQNLATKRSWPVTPRHFAWQAWHLVTSTFVSRGRCGTVSHPRSFCVGGVALMALGGALGPGLVARSDAAALWNPPSFHVAGVAHSQIHGRFAWQAWHSWHGRFAWQAWHSWHWVTPLRPV